jgi:ubiquinone biosynthesis protein UbiJ
MTEEMMAVVISVTFFITAGGVLVLRPIATRLGSLLEAMSRQKMAAPDREETARLREQVDFLERRLSLLEERQNFTESLVSGRERSGSLPPGGDS